MALVSAQYGFDTLNGQVFVGSNAAAGVILPIYSNLTQTFTLWNPTGSGKNAVLIRCDIGYVSTTAAASTFVYSYQLGVGSTAATAAPITVFTKGTPINCLLGGPSSSMNFAPATCTLTAANTLLKTTGISQLVTTAATTTGWPWIATDLINGAIVVTPGTLISVSGLIAPLQTEYVSLTWEEV